MIGYDLLGLGHKLWPVTETIQALPSGVAIGCFDNTFGEVAPNLKKMLQSGKFPVVRVHFWWDNNHELAPVQFVEEKAIFYKKFAELFPAVKFYLSPSCEHKEKDKKKVKRLLQIIENRAPNCTPVNSIWTGARVEGYLTETHGVKAHAKPGEIVSTDGISIYDINAEKWIKKNSQAAITFLWGLRFNLREVPEPGHALIPPKSRTAVPTVQYTKGIIRLTTPSGEAPKPEFTGKVIRVKKPRLYKTYAEDSQGVFDARENKPVLILPIKANRVIIITSKGQEVGHLAYGGTYQGQHRYYSGVLGGIAKYGWYGWEIGKEALELSGSEFVWFKVNGKIFGPVNPAFRTGYYQV